MTIYIPSLEELPRERMTELGLAAEFSVRHADGVLRAYVYEWPDLRVVVNVTPGNQRRVHLEDMVAWLEARSHALGQELDGELARRIRATTIILGLVVEKTLEQDVWFERVQDMIAMICFNTKALLFWEGAVFDENCTRMWPKPT